MRTIIVEDDLLFRELLTRLCVQELGHIIVGLADSASEAVGLTLEKKPDLIIMDVYLKDADGIAILNAIRGADFAIRVVVVSAWCSPYAAYRLHRNGARVFVDKRSGCLDDLRRAIVAAELNEVYLSDFFRKCLSAGERIDRLLSPQEQRIVALVGQGLTDLEIAMALSITERTAKTHKSNVMRKLGIGGVVKLMSFAMQFGFVRRN